MNDEQLLTLRRIVAWQVETAGSHESNYVAPLLDSAKDRGFAAETTALDMGYDNERVYGECEERDSRPIIPLAQARQCEASGPYTSKTVFPRQAAALHRAASGRS